MRSELEQQLFKKYPKIFAGKEKPITQNLMGFGFECNDGWYNLINSLCRYLQWDTDHNNYSYVIENKFLRKFIPFLNSVIDRIPGSYDFEKFPSKANLSLRFTSKLRELLSTWRKTLKIKKIENGKYVQIKAVQVKEKFGGLRFYTDYSSDLQQEVINFAESLSTTICEICGSPGKILYLNGGYWMKTLCTEHAKELGYKEFENSNNR